MNKCVVGVSLLLFTLSPQALTLPSKNALPVASHESPTDIPTQTRGVEAGIFSLGAPSYSVVEGDGNLQFTINRGSGSSGAVSVSYILSNAVNANGAASCSPGIDFVNTGATLNFADGETSQPANVQICDDAVAEEDTETFDIFLQNPTGGASIGSPATATVTINDDDGPPDMNVSTESASVADGDTTPSIPENTDFGTTGTTFGTVTRSWTISNVGISALLLDGMPAVQVTGANAGDFSVTLQPALTTLGSNQQTTF